MSWARGIFSCQQGEVEDSRPTKAEAMRGIPKTLGVAENPVGSCAAAPKWTKEISKLEISSLVKSSGELRRVGLTKSFFDEAAHRIADADSCEIVS